MIDALNELEVITLFAEDLPATKAFYEDVFGLRVVYADPVSAVFKLGSLLLNVLHAPEARELVEPTRVAGSGLGARLLLTIKVADVDAVCAELARHGVKTLNGPVDRPWGRRTAAFADPAGNVWEVAQEIRKG